MPDHRTDEELLSLLRNRWVKFALAGLVALPCLAVLVWLVYRLRGVLIPFGLATVAAYILNPIVEYLQSSLHWPRVPTVISIVAVLTILLLAAASLALYSAVTTIEEMVPAARGAIEASTQPDGLLDRIRVTLAGVPHDVQVEIRKVLDELPGQIKLHLREISSSVLEGLGALVGSLLGIVLASFNFVVFFVVMGYLLVDLPRMRQVAIDLLPMTFKDDIVRIARELDTNLRAFFRGQVLVALALGVIYAVGLTICGVDFGLLIGFGAGLVSIVPYLGVAVGLVPAMLFALPYSSIWTPLSVILVFVIGQTIEGLLLTPKIIGRNVGLSPVVVILSIMIFGTLLGFFGVIFAVPLAAVTKVMLGELARYYKKAQEQLAAD